MKKLLSISIAVVVGAFAPVSGTHALYFRTSEGTLDFAEFTIR